MFRTKYSNKVIWLGIEVLENEIESVKYHGNYFIVCRKCPNGNNPSSKLGNHIQYRRNGDFVISLKANQIDHFKKNHDISDGHKWTILHDSVVTKYVQNQMIGGKACLVITV